MLVWRAFHGSLISRIFPLNFWLVCLSSYPSQDCNLRLAELWIFLVCVLLSLLWHVTFHPLPQIKFVLSGNKADGFMASSALF